MNGRCCGDRTYSTSQIAKLAGVHPNTVRLYEQWGFLPPVPRKNNGYRVFGDWHAAQLKLVRTALKCDYVEGGIRRRAKEIVKAAAAGNLELALKMAYAYHSHVRTERSRAEEALVLAQRCQSGINESSDVYYRRGDVARLLETTVDILRDWERNGLIDIPRAGNNYRLYGSKEINRLKIIRALRSANYSMMSILRMFNCVQSGRGGSLRQAIDTPLPEEDIVSAADRWITTLSQTESDANEIIAQLKEMIKLYK